MELNTSERIRYQTILDLLKTPMKCALLDHDVPMESQRPAHDYAVGYPRFTKEYCEHQEAPELHWGITESVLQLDRLVSQEVGSECQENMIPDLRSVEDIARREFVEPMMVAFEELGTAFALESDMKTRPRRDNREVFSDGLMSGPPGDFVFSYRNTTDWSREVKVPYLLLSTILPFSINMQEWMNRERDDGLALWAHSGFGATSSEVSLIDLLVHLPSIIQKYAASFSYAVLIIQRQNRQSSRLDCPHIVLFDGSTLVHIEFKGPGKQSFDPLDPVTSINIDVVWDYEDGINLIHQTSSSNSNRPRSTMREVLFSVILSGMKRAACEYLTFPSFLPPPGSFNTPLGVDGMQANLFPPELKGYVVTWDRVGRAVYYKEIDSFLSIFSSWKEDFLVEAYSPVGVTKLRIRRFIWMRYIKGAVVPISIAS